MINLHSLAGGRGCSRRLALAATVTLERPRWGELAEFVPDHVFRAVHLVECPAVVNEKRRSNEVRDDGAVARPRFDRLLVQPLLHDLGVEPFVHIRSLLDRPAHKIVPVTSAQQSWAE